MNMKDRFLAGVFCIALSGTCLADINDSGIKISWGYKGNTGPERWGVLSKAFSQCSLGKDQSPINILTKSSAASHVLVFHYQPSPVYLLEDGTTDLLLGNTHTLINTGHGIQANFHPESHESISFDNTKYHLLQFHIHSPSENLLYGRSYPLEIHFVHQTDDGRAAVVAVFVEAGSENKELQTMVSALPIVKGKEIEVPNATIDPAKLLPTINAFYTFAGSLTTPPCSEGIQWIVLTKPIDASPAQIAVLRKESGGMNARPVQPLNKRTIYHTTMLNESSH